MMSFVIRFAQIDNHDFFGSNADGIFLDRILIREQTTQYGDPTFL